jgi:hypothetical protein
MSPKAKYISLDHCQLDSSLTPESASIYSAAGISPYSSGRFLKRYNRGMVRVKMQEKALRELNISLPL